MQVSKINNQNPRSTQSFKGVNIFRSDYTNLMSVAVWATKQAEDDAVHFIDGKFGGMHSLGTSESAKNLTNMLRNLGEKMVDPENLTKAKALFSKVVTSDIVPALEKVHNDFEAPYSLKSIIAETSLADMKTVIDKGHPKYSPEGRYSKNSYRVLSLEFAPAEKVEVQITREQLAKLGLTQV